MEERHSMEEVHSMEEMHSKIIVAGHVCLDITPETAWGRFSLPGSCFK